MTHRRLGRRILPAFFAVISALGAIAGCGVTDPPWLVESLVLESVGGEPLPSVRYEGPVGRSVAVADTLLLRADGTGIRRTVMDRYEPSQAPDGSVVESGPKRWRREFELTWSLEGNRFIADVPCPDFTICLPSRLAGVWEDGHLVLDEDRLARVPAVYRVR